MWAYNPTMCHGRAGAEKELTLMQKHLLCARHLLVHLHTPHNKAHEGRNCCHSFTDEENEAHRD